MKYFCPNSSSLSTIYDSSKSKVLKMFEMKNQKNFTNKKLDATPNFCKQNFSQLNHINFNHTLCQCSFLCIKPALCACSADQPEQQQRHWQQSMARINMEHPRKSLFAETWGNVRFFICKFFFVFHFDHFQGVGFGTIIDGANGGSVMEKKIIWVELVWVKSI